MNWSDNHELISVDKLVHIVCFEMSGIHKLRHEKTFCGTEIPNFPLIMGMDDITEWETSKNVCESCRGIKQVSEVIDG